VATTIWPPFGAGRLILTSPETMKYIVSPGSPITQITSPAAHSLSCRQAASGPNACLIHARKERHTLEEQQTFDSRRRLLWFHCGPGSAAGGGDGAVAILATSNGHHFALPAKTLHRVEEGFDDVDGQREDNR